MVKIRKSKKIKEEVLPIENADVLSKQISQSEEFVKKNQNLIIGVLGTIIIVLLSFSLFNYYKENQNINAQEEMFQAVYYYEQDSIVKALNGDGNNYGFLEIIDEYGFSEAANLSNFYAGSSYLKLGNYENAIKYLKSFSSSDLLIQARAYSLIGDAYVEMMDYDNAIKYFEKASSNNPNEYFTPSYLLKLALVYEQVDDLESALDCYITIINEFKVSSEFQISIKNRKRIEGLMLWVLTLVLTIN